MATNPSTGPSFFNFLKEGVLLPTRNRGLFIAVGAIVIASTTVLLLGSDLAVQPLADEIQLDVKALNSTDPGSPDYAKLVQEIQNDAKELLLEGAGYLLFAVVISSAVRILLLFATVLTYSGEQRTTFRVLLGKAKAQLKGPLLTLAFVYVLEIVYIVFLALMGALLVVLMKKQHFVLLILASLLVLSAAISFVYFCFVCSLSVVVAVAEPGCHGAAALGRACRLAKGKKWHIASAELVQKIASLVVDAMGGVVEDADAMNREWSTKSRQLCAGLNSIALPLGSLGIGLSRHRSLLFKVLADRVNLPCKLVKGICYTGTDEGAINFVKIDFDSAEYIVDLMGAPGTLIPSEISVSQFQDSNNSQLSSDAIEESVAELCIALEQVSGVYESKSDMGGSSSDRNSVLALRTPHLEDTCHTENPLKQHIISDEGQFDEFNIKGSVSQQNKVNDTSKYLVPGVVDPQFAQNLHDLLLEGGALLPSGLLSCQNSHNSGNTTEMGKNSSPEVKEIPGWMLVAQTGQNSPECSVAEDSLPKIALPPREDVQYPVENTEATIRSLDTISTEGERVAEDSLANMSGSSSANLDKLSCSSTKTISSVMDDVAEYEISWEDLHIGERIGLGSYGEVYHADWNGTEVAVKKFLDQDLSGVALEQFKCEVRIMSRLRHPNVVLFLGYVTQPPNLSILTEYLPRGSLYRLLHRPNSKVDETRRLKMALDVAKGMNYLHTSHPTIVHRDLKSPNLLVDKNWVVKVSDFGMSRLKHNTFLSSKSTAGTPEWMAPEVLRNEPANEMCDVYSFGVILWELATLCVPWSGLNPMQVVGAVGFQNKRLDIPKEVDPLVASIISSCWDNDPSKRPSFSQLLSPLKKLQRLLVTESL